MINLNLDGEIIKAYCQNCKNTTKTRYFLCMRCGEKSKFVTLNTEIFFAKEHILAQMEKFCPKIEIIKKLNNDNPWRHFSNGIATISFSTLVHCDIALYHQHVYEKSLKRFTRDASDDDIGNFLSNQDMYFKESLLVHFLFTLEHLFDNLIRYSTSPKKLDTLYDKTKHLFAILNLGDSQSELFNQVIFPQKIRNVLHSGGIYNDVREFKATIKEINFKLIPNSLPRYGSWYHVYFCYMGLMDVVEKLFQHPHYTRLLEE